MLNEDESESLLPNAEGGAEANGVVVKDLPAQVDTSIEGVIRTLDGEEISDEFAQDAMSYRILLNKIDLLLDRLKLDA